MQQSDSMQNKISKSLDELMQDNENDKGNSAKQEAKPARSAQAVTNRVYVGNLSWQTSWQDLKDHFRQVGEPVHASVFLDENNRSKGCGIVEFATKEEAVKAITELNDTTIGDTGRLIFVREDREDRNAPRSEKTDFGSRPRRGRGDFGGHDNSNSNSSNSNRRGNYSRDRDNRPDRDHNHPSDGESTKGRQVFVGNLPYHTSWQDLKDTFRASGTVVRADILLLPNGRSKGQGTVLFETKAEAAKAIEQFDNSDFQGRKITVHEDKFAN